MLKALAKFTVDGQLRSLVALCGNRPQRRFLNIHENAAYKLLRSVGIPTPEFGVAQTPDEAAKIATQLDSKDLVVKAQVLSGGRGKGRFIGSKIGGVVTCESPEEVKELARMMLGKRLVTKQTGSDGWICNSVMVTTRMFTRKELYLSVMMERSFNGPVIISSSHGGVNIEDIAAKHPEAITYTPVNPLEGLNCKQVDEIASSLGVPDVDVISEIVYNLYDLFMKTDALLLEVNPLVQDIHGHYYALDCKCNFDDEAKFRQEELFSLKDNTVKSPAELKAEEMCLNYIPLEGNIACMVNGAGLAMATMDIIKLYGGEPANFLDVGGSAEVSAIKEAVKIISSDPKVESILVNIFGGILRCDIVAEGIVAAFKCFKHHVPTVVRLQGTNFDEAKKIILDSKLNIIPINDLAMAAEASVIVAYICQQTKKLNLDISITPSLGKY